MVPGSQASSAEGCRPGEYASSSRQLRLIGGQFPPCSRSVRPQRLAWRVTSAGQRRGLHALVTSSLAHRPGLTGNALRAGRVEAGFPSARQPPSDSPNREPNPNSSNRFVICYGWRKFTKLKRRFLVSYNCNAFNRKSKPIVSQNLFDLGADRSPVALWSGCLEPS